MVENVCGLKDGLIEANDTGALWYLSGQAHHIGPFMNVYNEKTLAFLAGKGAKNFCLPPELPAAALGTLADAAAGLGVTVEVQVFGRVPLALSARCYHARVHGRTKDSCQFVCEVDPVGLDIKTLEGNALLAINGVLTLDHAYLNLVNELSQLRDMGVTRFRLSPHSCDMVSVANVYRQLLDRHISTGEANAMLEEMRLAPLFANGFFHGKPGFAWHQGAAA